MHYFLLILPIIIGYINNEFWIGLFVGIILCAIGKTAAPGTSGSRTGTDIQDIYREIGDLKRRVRNLESQRPSSSEIQAEEPVQAPPPQPVGPEASGLPSEPEKPGWLLNPKPMPFTEDAPRRPPEGDTASPASPNRLPAWLFGGNPLLKAGVFVLFLGLAFLLRYASERISIPIAIRYLSVAAAGMAATAAGWKLQRRRREYGLVLQGFGIAVMYLTTLAALKLHPMISAAAAFSVMFGLTAFMAALAVRQNALPMAQIALIGGMAAPLLVSDGGGKYIILFSYLALLNAGIAFIAWFKTWRSLNLAGFAGTFLIASLWGEGAYDPRHFAATEPFLIYHWLLYTLIVCFFARNRLRESPNDAAPIPDNATLSQILQGILAGGIRVHILDHILLFGTMSAAFGLQCRMASGWTHGAAWSASGFAAAYAVAALLLYGRRQMAVLRQAFAAIALLFVTLAIPLWLDNGGAAAIWTLEAALAYTFGLRKKQPHVRLFALTVYLSAALIQLDTYGQGGGRLLNGSVSGTLLTAGGGLYAYFMWRNRQTGTSWENRLQTASLGAALFYLCLTPALLFSADIALITSYSVLSALLAAAQYRHRQTAFAAFAVLAGFSGISGLSGGLSTPHGLKDVLGILLLCSSAALSAAAFMLQKARWRNNHAHQPPAIGYSLIIIGLFWAHIGWLDILHRLHIAGFDYAYALLLSSALTAAVLSLAARRLNWHQAQNAAHIAILAANLYLLDNRLSVIPQSLWAAFYFGINTAAYCYILSKPDRPSAYNNAIRIAGLLIFAAQWTLLFGRLGQSRLDDFWIRQLAWLAAPVLLWLLLTVRKPLPPFKGHTKIYQDFGGTACALFAAFWLLYTNIAPPSAPLPYLPLLNPIELASAFLLYQGNRWLKQAGWVGTARQAAFTLIMLSAFAAISTGVMRMWHFYGGIKWQFYTLAHSFGLQASLSVVWAVAAIIMMVWAHAGGNRAIWFAGMSLMGVTVIKMFAVELGNSGGIARIVSFISVGLLLLLVGWFAPLPPKNGNGTGQKT